MGIKIQGLKPFQTKVKKIQASINGTQMQNDIGLEFKKLVQQTFNDKKSPFGKTWQPSHNPDTLVDTGALFSSVNYTATKNQIVVFAGSGLDYARQHNDGEGLFPKRQFIPNEGKLPKKWRDISINIIKANLKEIAKIGFK